jgi:hypothetical protein
MVSKMIPFPIEKKNALTIADARFLTMFVASAMEALAQTGRSSMVIWAGEPPALPYKTDTWDLLNVSDEFRLNLETQRRINIIRNNNIPIKQILIAHEHPSEKQRLLEVARREERRKEAERAASNLVRALAWLAAVLAIGVVVVAALPVILTIVGVIAGLLLVGSAAGFDPAVVVVLDDGYDSWLMINYWYD